MYQKIVIVGNVGRDPKVNHTSNGTKVANFSVAVNDYKDETTWVTVTVWNKLAELVEQYVRAGSKVLCEGRFAKTQEGYYPAWLSGDGEARSQAAITAHNVRFLSSRSDNGFSSNDDFSDEDNDPLEDLNLDLEDTELESIPF